jgi:hypothetical protein
MPDDPTEQVARVAQVLCDGDKGFWDHEPSRAHYMRQAQAAIDAHTKALQLTKQVRIREEYDGKGGGPRPVIETQWASPWVEGER